MCGPVWQYGFRRRKLSVVQKRFPGAFMVVNLNGRWRRGRLARSEIPVPHPGKII
jgi:hypothetical protein